MSNKRITRYCICCGGENINKSSAILMPFIAKRVFDHAPVLISPEWGINDLKPGMAYSVCNTLQCGDCGAMFLDMRFSDAEMALLYADYRGEEYNRLRISYEPAYAKVAAIYNGRAPYIETIENFLTTFVSRESKVLDWGGDTGVNTPFLHTAQFVHIYDISNLPTVGTAEAVDILRIENTKYDLIVCSQVLEHVPYPLDIINNIVSIMDEETLFYIEVPYEKLMRQQPGSKEIYLEKHHWHEHINFFSEESLLRLIDRAGLKLLQMESIEITLGDDKVYVLALVARRSF